MSHPNNDSSVFAREPRYVVIKISDANAYLDVDEKVLLENLHAKCAMGRINDGRRRMDCVVVESDWSEYEPTWNSIESQCTK